MYLAVPATTVPSEVMPTAGEIQWLVQVLDRNIKKKKKNFLKKIKHFPLEHQICFSPPCDQN